MSDSNRKEQEIKLQERDLDALKIVIKMAEQHILRFCSLSAPSYFFFFILYSLTNMQVVQDCFNVQIVFFKHICETLEDDELYKYFSTDYSQVPLFSFLPLGVKLLILPLFKILLDFISGYCHLLKPKTFETPHRIHSPTHGQVLQKRKE